MHHERREAVPIVGKTTTMPGLKLSLSAAEAAAALGISERALWTRTNSGEVPHVRIGSRILYPVRELEQWLAAQTQGGGATGREVGHA